MPAWARATVYDSGAGVSHRGGVWRAKWWTQGQEPGTTGERGVWQDVRACRLRAPRTAEGPAPLRPGLPLRPRRARHPSRHAPAARCRPRRHRGRQRRSRRVPGLDPLPVFPDPGNTGIREYGAHLLLSAWEDHRTPETRRTTWRQRT
ncbi:carbohydrate-binding protein [Streptomyces sp. B5E4]|uniref:carbohydrate-binding protein n=1 Tax=Streptomyces sp. B5E4 TaxID=3153568 RepID=UPI00325DDD7E